MNDDIQHLARILPPPVESDLATDRHRLLKEHLMDELTHPVPATHRRLVPVAVAALVAIAVGATAVAVYRSGPRETAHTVATPPESPAARLLDHVALVAARAPAVTVGPHQFVYLRSTVSYLVIEGQGGPGKVWTEPVHQREIWIPNDPSMPGLLKENGHTETLPAGPDTNDNLVGHLPADSQELKMMAYEQTKGTGHGPDPAAFDWIGSRLHESLPSPEVSAALYRAAALIPSVSVIDDAVDAAGRHGVAVGLTDPVDGERIEWIFDPATFAYLGEHNVATRDQDGVRTGTVTGQSAVLVRAVVDAAGEIPAS